MVRDAGETLVDLREHIIDDPKGRSRTHKEDHPEHMYIEDDDSGQGERDMQGV